jgi:rubrerythrin
LQRLFARAVRGAVFSSVAFVGCASDAQHDPEPEMMAPSVVDVKPPAPPPTSVAAMAGAPAVMAGAPAPPPPTSPTTMPPTAPPTAPTVAPPAAVRDALTCLDGAIQLAPGLTLVREFDYVADRVGVTVVSSMGQECGHATAPDACRAAVAAARSDVRNLLTIEGDSVRIWQGEAALQLFGELDTPEEAVYRLLVAGYQVPCSAAAHAEANGFRIEGVLLPGNCATKTQRLKIVVTRDGSTQVLAMEELPTGCMVDGRRPEGLRSAHRERGRSTLGEHFARMAHGEAASVPAFATIADELVRYRAPRALLAQARRAIDDERRHARIAGSLAMRFGVPPSAPLVERRPLRELEAFALDNAVEGCVHETYAAASASYQAAQAADPAIAQALGAIAADETRHSAFAFALARWLRPQLNRAAQRRVRQAQRVAVEQLAATPPSYEDRELQQQAGLPDAGAARALIAGLRRELWNA